MTTPTNGTNPDARVSPHSSPSPPIPAEPRPLVHALVLATQVPDNPARLQRIQFRFFSRRPGDVTTLPLSVKATMAYRAKLALQRWFTKRHPRLRRHPTPPVNEDPLICVDGRQKHLGTPLPWFRSRTWDPGAPICKRSRPVCSPRGCTRPRTARLCMRSNHRFCD